MKPNDNSLKDTLEFQTEADARIALAMLRTLNIQWKVAEPGKQEERESPLITEERW